MKRPYRSRLQTGLIAASAERLVRAERLLVMRRICKWVSKRRHAPTVEDLLHHYDDFGEPGLRLRLLDLSAEGMLVQDNQRGWVPQQAGWDLVFAEPVSVLFSSNASERNHQYRMLAYYRQAIALPNFTEMLAYFEQARHLGQDD